MQILVIKVAVESIVGSGEQEHILLRSHRWLGGNTVSEMAHLICWWYIGQISKQSRIVLSSFRWRSGKFGSIAISIADNHKRMHPVVLSLCKRTPGAYSLGPVLVYDTMANAMPSGCTKICLFSLYLYKPGSLEHIAEAGNDQMCWRIVSTAKALSNLLLLVRMRNFKRITNFHQ